MPTNKQITVAIPVYNGQRYILDALQSIVDQTQKVDQIIVCDNQSTDDTVSFVKQFFSEHQDIICRLQQNTTNLGYQRNFNKCMELCETGYLLLLSSDDIMKPYTIEKQVRFFDANPEFAVVGGWADNVDENGSTINQSEILEDQFYKKGQILEFVEKHGFFIHPSTVLMNMEMVRKIGYWDEYLGPDERFWPRVLQHYAIAILGESFANRRIHLSQTARLDYISKYHDLILSFKANLSTAKLESTPERIDKLLNVLCEQVAFSSIMMGATSLRYYGKFAIALKYWMYGVRIYPSIVFKKNFYKSIEKSILYRVMVFTGRKENHKH